jgi:hypothetical protein
VKPDFAHLAPDTADRLSRKQAETLLLLHLTQPTLARGIPASVFKALRNKLLARSGPGEREWFLTEFGGQVQDVLRERGGFEGLG